MTTTTHKLARALKICVICAIAFALVRRIRGGSGNEVTGTARWKPLVEPKAPPQRTEPVKFTDNPTTESDDNTNTPTWVEPVDGECPASQPIKGNSNSGIFHIPGGRSYARTVPERCYASAEDAEADGFRQAKR